MSCKLVSLFAASFAIAAAFAMPAVADTDPATKTISVRVVYADLDLSNPAGVQTLASRLSAALDTACGGPAERVSLRKQRAIKLCRAEALEKAVTTINSPLLTAFYRDARGAQIAGM